MGDLHGSAGMSELMIKCSWEEDPGVAEPVLARSWAQLSIMVDQEPVTRFLSLRSNSVRDAVYGAAYPLAAWVVDNWWFLLNEGARHLAVVRGARSVMRDDPSLRFWLRRHNLLAAREGYALPDLSIFRDASSSHVCWAADPVDDFPRRGRFISAGAQRIPLEACRDALGEFVRTVLERLDPLDSEDVTRLRAQWLAVQENDADDAEYSMCSGLASLGIHPFSPEAEDEALRAALATLSRLALPVQQDLLDATSSEHLGEDIKTVSQWLESSRDLEAGSGPWRSVPDVRDARDRQAFEAGYLRARRVRDAVQIGPELPLDDLAEHIRRDFGAFAQVDVAPGGGTSRRIDAVVTHQPDAGERWLAGPPRSELAARFRLGRALHQWLFTAPSQRLLTRSQSGWEQRASRAFAAELLVPAASIRRELEAQEGDGSIGRIARKYRVDDAVVAWQIENHSIEVT